MIDPPTSRMTPKAEGQSEVTSPGAENLRPDDPASLVDSALSAARQGLFAWNISGDARLLKRLENFTYEAGADGNEWIVRVTEPSHRSVAQLDAELDWLTFLDHQGVGVAPPLPSASGARLPLCGCGPSWLKRRGPLVISAANPVQPLENGAYQTLSLA